MKELFKDLIPSILTSQSLDPEEILSKTIKIMALMLDDVRLKVEAFPEIIRSDYEDNDRVPNGLMQTIFANSFGIDLKNIQTSTTKDRDQKIYQVWNRIINNLFYILKTKGTRQAIKYCMVLYGIDPNRISFNEYTDVDSNTNYRRTNTYRVPLISSGIVQYNPFGFGATGTSSYTLELQVKRDSVGQILYVPYIDGALTLYVNQGAITANLGYSVSNTSTLTAFSSQSLYNISVRRSSTGFSVYRHNRLRTDLNSTTSVLVGDIVVAGSFSSITASPTTNFYTSFTGGYTELRTWNHNISNSDLEYRLFNPNAITTTGSISGLVNRYRFNEGQTVSANLTASTWFYNNSNTGVKSTLITDSLSSNALSSIYTYLVNTREDNVQMMGLQPTQTKIGLSANNKFTNLMSIGFNSVEGFNNFLLDRDRNFNTYNLYGNNEEFYNKSLTSIDTYLSAVYTAWNSKFINLSKYDEIIDNTEYLLASFFEFIKQLLNIKTLMIEEGSVIKSHILPNISHARKDNSLNTEVSNFDPKLKSKVDMVMNSYFKTLSGTPQYSEPTINPYYRDQDDNIITPVETIASTDSGLKANIFPTGLDYMIVSNETEDIPYNYVDGVILITDDNGDAIIGAIVRATADGTPSKNAWQFIDSSSNVYIYSTSFLNEDESGIAVRIKYDNSIHTFTEDDNKSYNFTYKTSNLGSASVTKQIRVKLARNIKIEIQDKYVIGDAIYNDPFVKVAYRLMSTFVYRDVIEMSLLPGIFNDSVSNFGFAEDILIKYLLLIIGNVNYKLNVSEYGISIVRYPILNIIPDIERMTEI